MIIKTAATFICVEEEKAEQEVPHDLLYTQVDCKKEFIIHVVGSKMLDVKFLIVEDLHNNCLMTMMFQISFLINKICITLSINIKLYLNQHMFVFNFFLKYSAQTNEPIIKTNLHDSLSHGKAVQV